MSTVDNSENRSTPPGTKSGGGSDKYVYAIVIVVLTALGIYQGFFCPDCYASADRTAVHDSHEP
jgi:hypothetical protein